MVEEAVAGVDLVVEGGGFGAGSLPPMGLTFADIQSLSREESALYPVCTLLWSMAWLR